jgi:hypothetical protein
VLDGEEALDGLETEIGDEQQGDDPQEQVNLSTLTAGDPPWGDRDERGERARSCPVITRASPRSR